MGWGWWVNVANVSNVSNVPNMVNVVVAAEASCSSCSIHFISLHYIRKADVGGDVGFYARSLLSSLAKQKSVGTAAACAASRCCVRLPDSSAPTHSRSRALEGCSEERERGGSLFASKPLGAFVCTRFVSLLRSYPHRRTRPPCRPVPADDRPSGVRPCSARMI